MSHSHWPCSLIDFEERALQTTVEASKGYPLGVPLDVGHPWALAAQQCFTGPFSWPLPNY